MTRRRNSGLSYLDGAIPVRIFRGAIKKSSDESAIVRVPFGVALLPTERVKFGQQNTTHRHSDRDHRKAT